MYSHSYIKDHTWVAVAKDHLHPFPYNRTLRNTNADILGNMVVITRYFKNLTPETAHTYKNVQHLWLQIAGAIPRDVYTSRHKELSCYFSQTLGYTPIRVQDGSPLTL